MISYNRRIAEFLLQIKAIKLETASPFTWASGWQSPIYCDNRKTLSFPGIRDFIRDRFVEVIRENFPGTELIAGVATGGIAQGALVADQLSLPFVYVRSAPKSHGLENLVEGVIESGQKTVVIEDLVSTGGSSLKAVNALKQSSASVLGLIAIFTYGFRESEKNFREAGVPLHTLCDYESLLEEALDKNYISPQQVEILREWSNNPSEWTGMKK